MSIGIYEDLLNSSLHGGHWSPEAFRRAADLLTAHQTNKENTACM
jgi:hypothetical protein